MPAVRLKVAALVDSATAELRADGECTCTECIQRRVIEALCTELRETGAVIEKMEADARLAGEVRPWVPNAPLERCAVAHTLRGVVGDSGGSDAT